MKEYLYKTEVIISVIILVSVLITHRLIIFSASKISNKLYRSKLRLQYLNRYTGYILWTVAVITIILVWGMSREGFFVALGSAFAVIGVALFASWSILSNVTASFILYFTFPYKIGDRIRIHDKDLPVTAVISDVKGFYTLLRTDEGEIITYPNNLLIQKGVSILNERKESIFDIPSDNNDLADPTAR